MINYIGNTFHPNLYRWMVYGHDLYYAKSPIKNRYKQNHVDNVSTEMVSECKKKCSYN